MDRKGLGIASVFDDKHIVPREKESIVTKRVSFGEPFIWERNLVTQWLTRNAERESARRFFMRVTKPAGFKGFLASVAIVCTPVVDSLVRPAVSGCRSEIPLIVTVAVPDGPKRSDSRVTRRE